MKDLPGYPRSRVEKDGTVYWLARRDGRRVLVVEGDASGFEGEPGGDPFIAPLTAANAQALRGRLPWLRPQVLGQRLSVGTGDRLGLATPGHLRAVRAHALSRGGAGAAPIVAQQSMRENARTGRSAQQVMDDALWGVFQEGWRAPWGADADHLKSTEHVDLCAAAGYTFYTVDPGDHVDDSAHTAPLDALRHKVDVLPWDALEDSAGALRARYLGRAFQAEALALEFDEESLLRAAAKYGRAIAHTARIYRHLAGVLPAGEFELEVSVDETATPTSPLEHWFIASELLRLGVHWVSLAPRYVGRFEKGADYIPSSGIAGDLDEFDRSLACHAAIARALGPYKLSIHTGSDKFSVYPLFARHAGHLVHLKTAGTSYLEALRAIARVEPAFFRAILALALEHYQEDRATYHVSGETGKVPSPETLADGELPGLLDQHDARQVLHVTFGSVLDRYRDRLLATLDAHEEEHYAALEAHFLRHLAPFG
ncbi:MAG: hypothetical protein JXA93_11480 [Anaerolineae bacterium]|nr:hypothetical protein [Anaerolineae bacterium]